MLVTGGAGYIGSHACKALRARRLPRRRLRQPRAPAIARRCATASWSKATSPMSAPSGRRSADHGISAVMHFAALLDVGESVREPVALLPQQRRRRAERARGDGGRVGAPRSSSRPPARPTASRSRRRLPKRIRSSRSTATARPSSRSSARCRTSSARTACADGAAVFQRGRRRSRRRDRRGSLARDPPDSARDRRRRTAGRGCRCSATTTRRPTAPACATTSTSPTWPTRTSRRSRRWPRRGARPPTISAPAGRTRCER